jgi:hypothetical protein
MNGVRLPLHLAMIALLASACSVHSYNNKVTSQAKSPDGRWKAVAFVRTCKNGDQSCGRSNFVSVVDASQGLPDKEGNALRIDSDVDLRLEWKRGQPIDRLVPRPL